MNTVGERIKKVREDLGLTGGEFGKKLSVTKVAVSNWENNNRKPDLDMLVKIAELGSVTTDYLLCLTEHPQGFIQEATINGAPYKFELDRDVFPNGLTYKQMIEYIEQLEKEAELSRKLKQVVYEHKK